MMGEAITVAQREELEKAADAEVASLLTQATGVVPTAAQVAGVRQRLTDAMMAETMGDEGP